MSISNISGDKTEKCQGGYDYWVVKLTENFNLIEGKAFADLNSNNLQDTGEPALKGITLVESYAGSLGFSNQNGNFDVVVMDSGNFTVAPLLLLHYSIVPASHNAYFPSMQLTDSLNDFAFQPTGVINDLAINITPTSPFRPGFNAHYNLHYRNVGTTSLTGTVIFYPDTQVTFVSSSVTPSFISADSIMWQTSLLNLFDAGDILVRVNVNQGTPIGTLVNSSAKIEPVPGDATPVNNYAWWEVFVTGSFDPNDILVNRAAITTTELLSPPYIEYIIRFQNTGTDTAFNAKLLNPLDTAKLQLNTFELMSASHPVNITWKAWERNMEFQFNNILLPDSNINEPMSHGYVRYRIKPKSTLAAGDTIGNNAFIYFDFNNPVATNTAITEIVLPTFLSSLKDEFNFSIFPNPATSDVTVSFLLKQDTEVEIKLYNALAQVETTTTKTFSPGNIEFHISTSDLTEGIYYIKFFVEGSVAVRKMVKM